MAAKEGSYQAARALLDHCANRDIQDHMDRLPVHIAQEKMHQVNILIRPCLYHADVSGGIL